MSVPDDHVRILDHDHLDAGDYKHYPNTDLYLDHMDHIDNHHLAAYDHDLVSDDNHHLAYHHHHQCIDLDQHKQHQYKHQHKHIDGPDDIHHLAVQCIHLAGIPSAGSRRRI